jgi:hypothetical protein
VCGHFDAFVAQYPDENVFGRSGSNASPWDVCRSANVVGIDIEAVGLLAPGGRDCRTSRVVIGPTMACAVLTVLPCARYAVEA